MVYILGEPELVQDINSLNPEKSGIIVKTVPFIYSDKEKQYFEQDVFSKTGVLLPGLEDIKDAEEQFFIACQKGRINPEEEKVFIYRFSAEKYQSDDKQ